MILNFSILLFLRTYTELFLIGVYRGGTNSPKVSQNIKYIPSWVECGTLTLKDVCSCVNDKWISLGVIVKLPLLEWWNVRLRAQG